MRKIYQFQENKFLSLGIKQQHKKCAELLEHILKGNFSLLDHYNEVASWLSLTSVAAQEKVLLDRLHEHYKLSDTFRKEHSLHVLTQDRAQGEAFLPIAIYLENLRSHHNIGSIIRTVEAFRLGRCITTQEVQVGKSAMGADAWVTCEVEPLDALLTPLIALETVEGATNYYDFCFPESFTLAVGNEEYGLSDSLLARADHIIKIPLYGRKNSINVACAFAIIASEIAKQRRS